MKENSSKMEKSYFDVLGLCCSSEVPLIEKILTSLEGVHRVSVVVPSRTVIVLHDAFLISQLQIVKALNQARLEANVRVKGDKNYRNKWPSPYAVACGVLLLLSFLHYFYDPLKWLALAAVAVGIFPIIRKAIASLRNFILDVNILMLIAVGGSIFLKDYWEAGTIVFLFTTAEWLESRASHKATAVMSSLMNIAPQKAVLADTGEEVNVNEVKVNTRLAVKAGDIIPIDGTVVEGKCEVDEKALTGESFPVSKQVDSAVWAGTINLNGYISVNTTALAEDCVVARMAKLVEEAQNNKSKTQRYIDKCAKFYTPAVVLVAAGLAVIPAAMRVDKLDKWFHLALVVLVSACPCALILSTPVATYCALSKAAATGLLIKGAEYLETLAKVKIICFDKTGTITKGEFSVSNFRSLMKDLSLDKLLYWVSSIESKSGHPMAVALIEYAQSHSVKPQPDNVDEFEIFPGEGIYGKIDGKDIYIGNQKIAIRAGCSSVPRNEHETKGKSTGYIFLGSLPAGVFALSDTCRIGVKEALHELKSMGVKTAMLTGDCQAAANHAQNQLEDALDIVHAELLPENKAQIIKEFQLKSRTAMVGDGINDAPALATADIGISMGISGSALATETGHVILMSNDIRKIPMAVKLARKTRRKIFENIILAMVTKAAIIALAVAGHPLVWAAVLADVGTCLVVVLNSMLLLQTMKIRKIWKTHSASSHDHKHCHSKKPLNVGKKHGCCGHDDNVHEMKHPVQVTEAKHGCCGHEGKVHETKHLVQVTEPKHGCCGHDDKVHEMKHAVQVTEDNHGCCGHDDKVHETKHEVQVYEETHGCCGHDGGVHEVKHCVQETNDNCCAHADEEVHDIEHGHTCCPDHDDDDDEIHEVQVKKHGCCGHDDGDDVQKVKQLVQGGNCNKIMTEDLESQSNCTAKTQGDCCHNQTNHEKPSCHLSVDKSRNCDGDDDHHHHDHDHGHGHGHQHVKEYITEEEFGKLVRNCCKSHGLEKRHVGGCCKSFRKECCGQNHFGVGGLSEIVIE